MLSLYLLLCVVRGGLWPFLQGGLGDSMCLSFNFRWATYLPDSFGLTYWKTGRSQSAGGGGECGGSMRTWRE